MHHGSRARLEQSCRVMDVVYTGPSASITASRLRAPLDPAATSDRLECAGNAASCRARPFTSAIAAGSR